MLEEILVIRESIPIFYYNSDPEKALNDDYYVLQSGFFVALSTFANEMSDDKLRYIVLENKLYALDEVSDIMIIFGDKEIIFAFFLLRSPGAGRDGNAFKAGFAYALIAKKPADESGFTGSPRAGYDKNLYTLTFFTSADRVCHTVYLRR